MTLRIEWVVRLHAGDRSLQHGGELFEKALIVRRIG
jgi:hypothetical protein